MNNFQWLLMLILTIILYYKYRSDRVKYKKQSFHHIFISRVITDIFIYGLLNYHIMSSREVIEVSNFENTLIGKCVLSLYGLMIYYILVIPYLS